MGTMARKERFQDPFGVRNHARLNNRVSLPVEPAGGGPVYG